MNGFGLHVIPMVGFILLSWLGLRSLGMERGAPPAAPGWPSGCTFPKVELPGGQSSQANKYEIISQWLLTVLTGLAVVLSRPSWQLLAKKGTLTATSQEQLQLYHERGYPAGLKDKVALPYALPRHNAIAEAEWQRRVGLFCHSQYSHDMEILYAERAGSSFAAFYNTMDFTNPIKAETYNRTEAVQQHNEQTERFEQTEVAQQAKGNNPH